MDLFVLNVIRSQLGVQLYFFLLFNVPFIFSTGPLLLKREARPTCFHVFHEISLYSGNIPKVNAPAVASNRNHFERLHKPTKAVFLTAKVICNATESTGALWL